MRWYLEISIALFSDTVRPRNLKFFVYINPYGYSLQTKFHVPLSHTFREKCEDNAKIQSCTIVIINKFEILQISIAFFSDTVRPRNLKFFLYINPYGYSLQTKFHVPRSHTFREKCDDNLKLASHFSPILCDRGTWNFFCILTHMDTLCKPKFMFLGRTLFEKNTMIPCKNSKLHNCPNKQLWNFTN